MIIKIVYHFIDSNLGLGKSSKRRVNKEKRWERVLEVVLPGRGANDLPCGRKGLHGPGVGENYTD